MKFGEQVDYRLETNKMDISPLNFGRLEFGVRVGVRIRSSTLCRFTVCMAEVSALLSTRVQSS